MKRIFLGFLITLTASNLLVKHYGAPGLWISSFALIPFDFVARCIIHERYSGAKLFLALFSLTLCAALVTLLINWDAKNIALASICGFLSAQLAAGIFYQRFKQRSSWFFKVNISDLIAIVADSIVFQFVAFNLFDWHITAGQIVIKFAGGLLWYWILFKKLEIWKLFTKEVEVIQEVDLHSVSLNEDGTYGIGFTKKVSFKRKIKETDPSTLTMKEVRDTIDKIKNQNNNEKTINPR